MYAVRKFEILNCRILQDEEGECYYVPKEHFTMPHIEIRDYMQDAQEFINEQEKIEFDLEKGEIIRFIISRDTNKVVLSIVQHHMAGDGKSLLLFLQEIMFQLEGIKAGNIIGCSEKDVVPVQQITRKSISKFVERDEIEEIFINEINSEWDKMEKKFFTLQELHQLFKKYWECNETKVATATVSNDKLNKFLTACKVNCVTVNNAMINSIFKSIKEKSKKICVIVDLRTEECNGFGNFASSIIVDVMYDEKLDFWDNARNVQKLISGLIEDRTKLYAGLLLKEKVNNALIDGAYFESISKLGNRLISEYNDLNGISEDGIPLVISNLGKNTIQEEYGELKIEELSVFSPLSVGLNSNMAVITENEKMVINLQYKDTGVNYKKILDDLISDINLYSKNIEIAEK